MSQCIPVNIQGMDTMSATVDASVDASKDPIELHCAKHTKHQLESTHGIGRSPIPKRQC